MGTEQDASHIVMHHTLSNCSGGEGEPVRARSRELRKAGAKEKMKVREKVRTEK